MGFKAVIDLDGETIPSSMVLPTKGEAITLMRFIALGCPSVTASRVEETAAEANCHIDGDTVLRLSDNSVLCYLEVPDYTKRI